MQGDWDKISYGITFEHRTQWGTWHGVRELVQNAMDEVGPENIEILRENGDLIIQDRGERGIKKKHLLLGPSDKKSDDARGRWGEGMKFAMMALEREGYKTMIKSYGLEAVSSEDEKFGERTFAIKYRDVPDGDECTRIIIKDYDGSAFEDRFRGLNRMKISLAENEWGELIRSKGESKLFVKDIYVKDLEDAHFSYNLSEVELDESREIADEWDLKKNIKRLWGEIDRKELWVELLEAMEDDVWESTIKFSSFYMTDSSKSALKRAFEEHFGEDAVIQTSEDRKKEADWRGADVLDMRSLGDLDSVLPTDDDYVIEDSEEDISILDPAELDEEEKERFHLLTNFFEREKGQFGLPSNASLRVAQFQSKGTTGISRRNSSEIILSRLALQDWVEACSVFLHEIAHLSYGTKDMTKKHIKAIERTGGKVLDMLFKEQGKLN